MAFKKKFLFLSDQDKENIEQLCAVLRRTTQSKRNMFYIVANFGEFFEGSVFESTQKDARNYIGFLEERCSEGQLKEHSCACVFLELRTFFDHAAVSGLMGFNPFSGIENPFQLPDRLSSASLPSLSEVDKLLCSCPDDSDILPAVLLALRMALSVSEIASLKKEQVCLDESKGRFYIKMWRWDNGEKKELFLYVPGDVSAHLSEQIRSTPVEYPYVFRSREKKPYHERSLQLKLERAQKDVENKICFSHLRSLSIYLMLQESIPVSDICRYVGTKPDWFTRYENIPESLICDAAEYVKLRVET